MNLHFLNDDKLQTLPVMAACIKHTKKKRCESVPLFLYMLSH